MWYYWSLLGNCLCLSTGRAEFRVNCGTTPLELTGSQSCAQGHFSRRNDCRSYDWMTTASFSSPLLKQWAILSLSWRGVGADDLGASVTRSGKREVLLLGSHNVTLIPPESRRLCSAECLSLLVNRGLRSHVCSPSGVACGCVGVHVDEKLPENTHSHTYTRTHTGPTCRARGGLRWINLKVAGWVSTAGVGPPAQDRDGNMLLSQT